MSSRNRRPGGRRFFAPGAENSAPLHARVQGPPPAAPLGRDGIMNQTENYQLSLWDPEDRIQRTDFNADNAKIEAALAGLDAAIAAGGNCRIYTTTYAGNNKNGADNPNTLTFPCKPVWVMVFSGAHCLRIFPDAGLAYTTVISTGSVSMLVSSRSGNTLSWYHTGNAVMQMNQSVNYHVLALLDVSA